MCPMCIGTATIVLSSSGLAGGAALIIGYLSRKKNRVRDAIRSLRLRGRLSRP